MNNQKPNLTFQEFNPINGVIYKMQCPDCGKEFMIPVSGARQCNCDPPRVWMLELKIAYMQQGRPK